MAHNVDKKWVVNSDTKNAPKEGQFGLFSKLDGNFILSSRSWTERF
jgi:hypothetical protein